MSRRYTLGAFLGLVIAGLLVNGASAEVITVPKDYSTIQTAINFSTKGDEIIVAPGTYNEEINFLGQGIYLHSSGGAGVTTITSEKQFAAIVTCASGEGPDTILEGFTITGGFRGMRNFNASSPTVRKCVFSNNCRFGIDTDDGDIVVEDCDFIGNGQRFGCGAGGLVQIEGSLSVSNCVFDGNYTDFNGRGGGIKAQSAEVQISDCLFRGNSASGQGGGGMTFSNSGTVEVQVGTLRFNNDYIQTAGQTTLAGGTLVKNGGPMELAGGSLNGNGLFDGDALNSGGALAPGLSAGLLTFSGAYTQQIDGVTQIELGGLLPGEFDEIVVGDTVSLSGELSVAAIDGFVPAPGDEWVILTAASVVGMFDTITGGVYEVSYDSTSVTLIAGASNPADLDGDGNVGPVDLAMLLASWGSCPKPCTPGDPVDTCAADFNGDCTVGPFDLATLLANWG